MDLHGFRNRHLVSEVKTALAVVPQRISTAVRRSIPGWADLVRGDFIAISRGDCLDVTRHMLPPCSASRSSEVRSSSDWNTADNRRSSLSIKYDSVP